jgi:toxin FitB
MILLDTNVLSELMRINPEQSVIVWMDRYDYKELGITSITVAEILYGIGLLPAGHKKQQLIEAARMLFEQDFNQGIFSFDRKRQLNPTLRDEFFYRVERRESKVCSIKA